MPLLAEVPGKIGHAVADDAEKESDPSAFVGVPRARAFLGEVLVIRFLELPPVSILCGLVVDAAKSPVGEHAACVVRGDRFFIGKDFAKAGKHGFDIRAVGVERSLSHLEVGPLPGPEQSRRTHRETK